MEEESCGERASSKWFDVRGSSADASMTTGVKGLQLLMDSTSARTVIRESSVKVCSDNKPFEIRLKVKSSFLHSLSETLRFIQKSLDKTWILIFSSPITLLNKFPPGC